MHTTALKKTIHVGKSARGGDVEIEVELNDGRLSMSGSVWLKSRRDIESGGQNYDSIKADTAKLEIDPAKLDRMLTIWRRWHLNDMRAGCEHQRAEGWAERPIDPTKPLNAYGKHFEGQRQDSWNMLTWVSRKEHPAGLLSEPCPVCGYRFGTAWLKEELPAEVIAEVESW